MADNFKYGSDVGVPSYVQIQGFAHESGVSFSVSSTTGGSHVNGSYHYKGNADDLTSSPGNMQKLASWLYQYSDYILELIHSGGPGYFVKNGKRVAASYYGAATVSQHYNHVHIAMTISGIAAAKAKSSSQSGTVTTDQLALANEAPKNGCALPAAMFLVSFLTSLIGVLHVVFS